MHYPQVDDLKALKNNFAITTSLADDSRLEGMLPLDLKIEGKSWRIFVNDLYNDLNGNPSYFSFYLALRELEQYKEVSDFMRWCALKGLPSSSMELLVYYKQLGRTVIDIENVIGKIDPKISSIDYEMRSSVINELIAAR